MPANKKARAKEEQLSVQNALSSVQIGIATKNRWADLKVTLEKVAEFGLGELRILIFDDCSDQPCPFDVRAICPGAELTRFAASRGYITRRNEIAREMNGKYYLSLDDDSFPHAGSLEAAVEYAESLPDNFCLGFPIYEPSVNKSFSESLLAKPHPVRAFIGCAHLLDRQKFLDVGGYREELIHQTEEGDVAVRAFQAGLRCRRFPGFQITHLVTNVGRNHNRIAFFSARNTLLWNDWYLPRRQKFIRQGRAIANRAFAFGMTRRIGHVQGSLAGLKDIARFKSLRQPLSLAQYRKWMSLPPS